MGYIPTNKVHHHFLTCRSINVDVWQVVCLSVGSPSRLIKPAPSPGHNRITRLAWLAGSILVVGNDPELVAGARFKSSDGEAGPRLLNDGLPTGEPSLKHLYLI